MKNKKSFGLFQGRLARSMFFLVIIVMFGWVPSVNAEVRVADFLEWATPLQIAKVEKTYDKAIGEKVSWSFYSSGGEMTEALINGEVDIAYAQGMLPFVTAINKGLPIKMVGIALTYKGGTDCMVRNALGITKDNAKELEGKKIAVPFNTMADFDMRMTMRHLGVDHNKVDVINAPAADVAYLFLETEVDVACNFGKNSLSKMKRIGKPLLTHAEKGEAGMLFLDIITVTEKFAEEKPEALRRFLKVTAEANAAFARDKSKIDIIANDAGLSVERAMEQITKDFYFPTVEEQFKSFFSDDGHATTQLPFMGKLFATDEFPAKSDYSKYIDTSFLK